ncbi:MAG: glycosyl hydrolase family 17 protein [Betaproteobacteria bacterium]
MKLSRLLSVSKLFGRAALALATTIVLVSCGGGGAVVTGVSAPRALSAEMASRNAVNYAPYRTSLTEPDRVKEVITEAMIKQDLDLLVAGNFRLIRLFDSSDKVAKQTLKVIRDNSLDIKVMLGVWIASGNDTENQAEIARGVALAKQYSDSVVALSVGNETMVSWSFNPLTVAQMAAYIKSVRNQVTQPVTTDDNWAFFAQSSSNEKNPRAVLDVIDFVAMHTYSLAETIHPPATWDWQQLGVTAGPLRATAMMDASIAAARQQYAAVRAHIDSVGFPNMPIVIGETGWKAAVSNGESNRAHPVNQKMYFDRLQTWTNEMRAGKSGPKSIFYFAAFDEQWKGSDDKWGLFNKDRQARYVVQSLYPTAQGYTHATGTYTQADALFAPDVTDAVVTGSRFTVYADSVPAGASAAVATGSNWFGWDNPPTAYAGEEDSGAPVAGAPGDSAHGVVVKPVPKVWGWGILVAPGNGTVTADLSAFEATGNLVFSIKTTYPGKIEIGFATGSGATTYDVYIPVSSGQYGYANDGVWHTVTIPIRDIKPFGNKASGNEGSATSVFDLTKVTNPFVVADRFGKTGNNQAGATNTKIFVDNIYWTR